MVNLDEPVSHGSVLFKRRGKIRMRVGRAQSPQTQHGCGILRMHVTLQNADGRRNHMSPGSRSCPMPARDLRTC